MYVPIPILTLRMRICSRVFAHSITGRSRSILSSVEVSRHLELGAPHQTYTDLTPCPAAEDVLGDLGVRQAISKMPKNARL